MESGRAGDREVSGSKNGHGGEKGGRNPGTQTGRGNVTRRSCLKLAAGVLTTVGGSSALTARASGTAGRRKTTIDRTAQAGSECIPSRETADEGAVRQADDPVIGANLNGRPRLLKDNLHLIDESNTTWVRAFLDIRKKDSSGVKPENDPDIIALRQVARKKNCNLIVSLKWDFEGVWGLKEPTNVPRPGSDRETELCQCATRYLEGIGVPIDIVVLGNEPMWETRSEDITVGDPPIVEFTRTAKDHLVERGDHGDPAYLVGAFNRTYSFFTRSIHYRGFHRKMFDMVRTDEDIEGIDLHLHYDDFSKVENALSVAREEVPDGIITVSEFSPVWRYDEFKDAPIDESEAGERFTIEHELPTGMTAVEYFEYAKDNPRSPEEIAGFYEAMPWYNENHIEDVYGMFEEYDVSVGTIGFLQGNGMRNVDWTSGWSPFHINFLYQPALLQTDQGVENTAHPSYIEQYRAVASRERSESTSVEPRPQLLQSNHRIATYLRRSKQRYLNHLSRSGS